jgi:transcriptional regulator with XRE-family HTH domain
VETLGERIVKIREQANLLPSEFARVLKLSHSYISYIEKGTKAGKPFKVSDQVLISIAYHFGVNLSWLKGGKGSMQISLKEEIVSRIWQMDAEEIEAMMSLMGSLDVLRKKGNFYFPSDEVSLKSLLSVVGGSGRS